MICLCENATPMADSWNNAVIVPLYKGRVSKSECKNYRRISLLLRVPGKVFDRTLIEGLQEVTV